MLRILLTLIILFQSSVSFATENSAISEYKERMRIHEQRKVEIQNQIKQQKINEEIARQNAYKAYIQQQQNAQIQAQQRAIAERNRLAEQSNSTQSYWDRQNNIIGGVNVAEQNRRADENRALQAQSDALANQQRIEKQNSRPSRRLTTCQNYGNGIVQCF